MITTAGTRANPLPYSPLTIREVESRMRRDAVVIASVLADGGEPRVELLQQFANLEARVDLSLFGSTMRDVAA